MKALIVLLATGSVMLAQTPAPKSAAPIAKAPAASNALLHPETLTAKAPEEFKVRFTTSHGDIVVAAHRAWSPIGVDRFYNLVKNKYFTNAAFFRIVPNFIVQFGMAADPKVGAAWMNANIKDDPMKPGINNKRGTLVFAKTQFPNSRTTQLFINLKDNTSSLDPQGFSPFAEVTEGMDVVDGLYAGYGERPDQQMITSEGKAYLDKNFPKLDVVKSSLLVLPEGAAPAAAATKSTAPAHKSTAAPTAAKSTAAAPARKTTGSPASSTAPAHQSTAVAAKSTAVAHKSTAVAHKSTAVARKSTAAVQ